MGLTAVAWGPARVGWGMTVALHAITPTRGSNGKAGEVPSLSFMGGMSLSPRLSKGKIQIAGKGPELGPLSGDESCSECPADLTPG